MVIVDNILNKCDKKITDTNYDSIYNKDNKNKRTSRYYKLYTD